MHRSQDALDSQDPRPSESGSKLNTARSGNTALLFGDFEVLGFLPPLSQSEESGWAPGQLPRLGIPDRVHFQLLVDMVLPGGED